jgi:uncharacterized protein (DUF433 family)
LATHGERNGPTQTLRASDDALISRYVEPHPHRHGPGDARIAEYGFSVWILIDALNAAGQDVNRVAREYHMPPDAVRAAIAFYEQHRDAIDARIRANAADFGVYV